MMVIGPENQMSLTRLVVHLLALPSIWLIDGS